MLAILGRTPSRTGFGIFSVMVSKHCSYHSSRACRRELPTKAPWVIHGAGENAGVIAIGNGLAAVLFHQQARANGRKAPLSDPARLWLAHGTLPGGGFDPDGEGFGIGDVDLLARGGGRARSRAPRGHVRRRYAWRHGGP